MDFKETNWKRPRMALASRWTRLLRGRILLVALGVVAVSSASAHARDVCIDFIGGAGVVLKRFNPPSRNRCVPIQGFENRPGGGALSGMGCTNHAGTTLIMHYTFDDWGYSTGFSESATCRVTLPIDVANGGSCRGTYQTSTDTGQNHFRRPITTRYCIVDIAA
jgi:hypothetical protein